MNQAMLHREMIEQVATAIGVDLLEDVAFVGGCTTALFLTDSFSLEQVRHTDDVDLIVHVVGYPEWAALQGKLRAQGFRDIVSEAAPICAMKLGELRVDFMPDDQGTLGFSNRWYVDALKSAEKYQLTENVAIRLVQPIYFVATKFEAYLGRGEGDPLGSRDIEDILTLFDGRSSIVDELVNAPPALIAYVAEQISNLIGNHSFEFAVQSAAGSNAGREELIFERLQAVVEGAPL
jgi:predicted nucleotidyltransferase